MYIFLKNITYITEHEGEKRDFEHPIWEFLTWAKDLLL